MCGIRIVRGIPGLSVLPASRSRFANFWLVSNTLYTLFFPFLLIFRVFELVRNRSISRLSSLVSSKELAVRKKHLRSWYGGTIQPPKSVDMATRWPSWPPADTCHLPFRKVTLWARELEQGKEVVAGPVKTLFRQLEGMLVRRWRR